MIQYDAKGMIMGEVKNYQDLIVWQKAMDVVVEVYRLTKKFPQGEFYGLTNQIRRAAISIPSNIAEGHTRNSRAEYLNFLSIAQGSRAEVETQMIISVRLGYLTSEETLPTLSLLNEINRIIGTIRQKLNSP
ncbi:MAG TPA: four helix bundle protein [Candidatus Hydrogenedentes bacterium]|nr:four helix bundle protein [Candidatus Hydrogenedentota bacterium]